MRGGDREARRPLDGGGADRLLRADLRTGLRPGPPDPAVRLAGHEGVGRRERDADPAGRRPKRAFVHFEVTVESFRRAMGASETSTRNAYELRVIDGRTGKVVIDSTRPQRVGAALGEPGDARFASLARAPDRAGHQGRRAPDGISPHRLDLGQRQRLDRRRQRQVADRQLALGHRASAGRDARARAPGRRARRRLAAGGTPRAGGPGDHGWADRAGQPPQADRRPRAPGPDGDRREPGPADAVRPQRIQELQRQLRPPGGRRAAAAARDRARRRAVGVRRSRIPAGGRRVLRHRRRRAPTGDRARRGPRALRARRRIRRSRRRSGRS